MCPKMPVTTQFSPPSEGYRDPGPEAFRMGVSRNKTYYLFENKQYTL